MLSNEKYQNNTDDICKFISHLYKPSQVTMRQCCIFYFSNANGVILLTYLICCYKRMMFSSNAHALVAEIVYMLYCYCALGSARMNFFDLANLLDNDGNLQNEMMVMSFAATLLATIPVSKLKLCRHHPGK